MMEPSYWVMSSSDSLEVQTGMISVKVFSVQWWCLPRECLYRAQTLPKPGLPSKRHLQASFHLPDIRGVFGILNVVSHQVLLCRQGTVAGDGAVSTLLGNTGFIWHQLSQRIGLIQRKIKHTRYVLDAHFGGHSAVGHDLRDLLFAVFLTT